MLKWSKEQAALVRLQRQQVAAGAPVQPRQRQWSPASVQQECPVKNRPSPPYYGHERSSLLASRFVRPNSSSLLSN
jgi:hypothetical protein